jgi:hypothetical protein
MKSLVFSRQGLRLPPLGLAFVVAAIGALSAACGKDPPPKPVDAPKKTTPVPSDMVFNDFVPAAGGGGIVGVKTDGGMLEGGMGDTPPSSGGAAGGDPAAGGGAPGAEDATKLKVTEPGAEPRAVRKYAFVANRSDKRVLTIRQSAAREGGGPAQEAAFAVTADFVPKVIKPTGTKFEMKVLKVDLPDIQGAAKAQAAAQLAVFTGLVGTFDVSSRGEVGEIEFKADEKMAGPNAEVILQSLQQALELVVPPFPDAPIGVGAKWERKVERKERGQENNAKHSFTLTEVSAEGGVVTAEVEVAVPKHAVQARGVPPGATEEVKGKGAYTYTFKFDHVSTKVNGELTITRKVELSDGKGAKQAVAEIMKLKNQVDTVGGTAAPAPAPKP